MSTSKLCSCIKFIRHDGEEINGYWLPIRNYTVDRRVEADGENMQTISIHEVYVINTKNNTGFKPVCIRRRFGVADLLKYWENATPELSREFNRKIISRGKPTDHVLCDLPESFGGSDYNYFPGTQNHGNFKWVLDGMSSFLLNEKNMINFLDLQIIYHYIDVEHQDRPATAEFVFAAYCRDDAEVSDDWLFKFWSVMQEWKGSSHYKNLNAERLSKLKAEVNSSVVPIQHGINQVDWDRVPVVRSVRTIGSGFQEVFKGNWWDGLGEIGGGIWSLFTDVVNLVPWAIATAVTTGFAELQKSLSNVAIKAIEELKKVVTEHVKFRRIVYHEKAAVTFPNSTEAYLPDRNRESEPAKDLLVEETTDAVDEIDRKNNVIIKNAIWTDHEPILIQVRRFFRENLRIFVEIKNAKYTESAKFVEVEFLDLENKITAIKQAKKELRSLNSLILVDDDKGSDETQTRKMDSQSNENKEATQCPSEAIKTEKKCNLIIKNGEWSQDEPILEQVKRFFSSLGVNTTLKDAGFIGRHGMVLVQFFSIEDKVYDMTKAIRMLKYKKIKIYLQDDLTPSEREERKLQRLSKKSGGQTDNFFNQEFKSPSDKLTLNIEKSNISTDSGGAIDNSQRSSDSHNTPNSHEEKSIIDIYSARDNGSKEVSVTETARIPYAEEKDRKNNVIIKNAIWTDQEPILTQVRRFFREDLRIFVDIKNAQYIGGVKFVQVEFLDHKNKITALKQAKQELRRLNSLIFVEDDEGSDGRQTRKIYSESRKVEITETGSIPPAEDTDRKNHAIVTNGVWNHHEPILAQVQSFFRENLRIFVDIKDAKYVKNSKVVRVEFSDFKNKEKAIKLAKHELKCLKSRIFVDDDESFVKKQNKKESYFSRQHRERSNSTVTSQATDNSDEHSVCSDAHFVSRRANRHERGSQCQCRGCARSQGPPECENEDFNMDGYGRQGHWPKSQSRGNNRRHDLSFDSARRHEHRGERYYPGQREQHHNHPGYRQEPYFYPGHHGQFHDYPGQSEPSNCNQGQRAQSKIHSGHHGPPNDDSANQGPPDDDPANQRPPNDYPGHSKSSNSNPGQRGQSKIHSGHHGPPNDDSANQGPPNDDSANQGPPDDDPANQGPPNDYPGHSKSSNSNPGQRGQSNKPSGHHGPPNDYPGHHGPPNDYPANQGPPNNYPGHPGPFHDYPGHSKSYNSNPYQRGQSKKPSGHHGPPNDYPGYHGPPKSYPGHHGSSKGKPQAKRNVPHQQTREYRNSYRQQGQPNKHPVHHGPQNDYKGHGGPQNDSQGHYGPQNGYPDQHAPRSNYPGHHGPSIRKPSSPQEKRNVASQHTREYKYSYSGNGDETNDGTRFEHVANESEIANT